MKIRFNSIKSILFKISDLTSEKKALSITAGFYLGIFPLTGVTTILCQLAVFKFKLNPVIVHSINLVLSPIQVLLIYPMMKTGRIIFYHDHRILPEITAYFKGSLSDLELLNYLIQTIIAGVFVWGMLLLLTGYFFYRMLLRLIAAT